jgi:exosortase/archaeosortase family protein
MGFLDFKFTEKFNPAQKRMWNLSLFLIRLLVLSIPLYLLMSFSSVLFPLQVLVASQVGWILQAMGYTVTQDIALITVSDPLSGWIFRFWIDADCTAWKSMLFAFALIFAVPRVKMRKRLYGLVLAIPVIWIGNLIRITWSVLIEQSYGLETAVFVHDVLWQLGLIVLVLAVWLIWLKWIAQAKKKH